MEGLSELELVERPGFSLVYNEARGPFETECPRAWKEFWQVGRSLDPKNIQAVLALSRMDDTREGDDRFHYQAGVQMENFPDPLPEPLQQRKAAGGKFARFVLKGPYARLADAYPHAFQAVAQEGLKIREEFCLEVYLNDPTETPESELLTEILIPV